jgi:transcriptional regulator with XRE-family HTH domain
MEKNFDQKQMKIRIKELKKMRKLTNVQLSIDANIPLGTLNNFLGSAVEEPKLNTVIALSKALHVSTDYLIFGENTGLSQEALSIAEKYENADERAKISIDAALSYLEKVPEPHYINKEVERYRLELEAEAKGAGKSSASQNEKEA